MLKFKRKFRCLKVKEIKSSIYSLLFCITLSIYNVDRSIEKKRAIKHNQACDGLYLVTRKFILGYKILLRVRQFVWSTKRYLRYDTLFGVRQCICGILQFIWGYDKIFMWGHDNLHGI